MKKWFFAVACLLMSQGEALLPPVWQDVAEIKAVLNDPQLNHMLDSAELIQSINRVEKGWEIHTNKSTVTAEIVPEAQDMPGPERFKVKFSSLALPLSQ